MEVQAGPPRPLCRVWPWHRLTQILQTHLDLELHLLLNADHLFCAAHLPNALVACFYHLGQGGHVRLAYQDVPSYHCDQYV